MAAALAGGAGAGAVAVRSVHALPSNRATPRLVAATTDPSGSAVRLKMLPSSGAAAVASNVTQVEPS